jgi:hypothetical protein
MSNFDFLQKFNPIYYHDGRLISSFDPISNTLYFSCTFGLSLLWEYCCIFKQFDYLNFRVSISQTLLNQMRNQEYYVLMKSILIELSKNFDNVDFVYELPYDALSPIDLIDLCQKYSQILGVKKLEVVEIFYPEPQEKTPILNFKYVVINTKMILSSELTHWTSHKRIISDYLNNLKIPVVLIGEKEAMKCREYDIHGAPSIYNEILNSFNKIIDLTIRTTEDLYKKEIMERNMNILKNSSLNIHFGGGGGRIVFAFLNNTISICSDSSSLAHKLWKSKYKNIETTDPDVYSKYLDFFLK